MSLLRDLQTSIRQSFLQERRKEKKDKKRKVKWSIWIQKNLNALFLLYRKFLKSSEIVYNRLEIKNDIAKERRGLRHDVAYEVFCFGLG